MFNLIHFIKCYKLIFKTLDKNEPFFLSEWDEFNILILLEFKYKYCKISN